MVQAVRVEKQHPLLVGMFPVLLVGMNLAKESPAIWSASTIIRVAIRRGDPSHLAPALDQVVPAGMTRVAVTQPI